MIRRAATVVSFAGLLPFAAGCDVDTLSNRTASFGGDIAGQRGQFRYVVINNTPYRAIFTAGAYDDLDQNTRPQSGNSTDGSFGLTLEENFADGSISDTFTPNCARVFAVGTPSLLGLIEDNLADAAVDPDALIEGVLFFTGDLDSEEGAHVVGEAPPMEKRLGVDFVCSSFLIIRLEIDDVGPDPFRVDFECIPASGNGNPPG